MHRQNCHICLTIDNFSAHYITYEPHNVHLLYFEPNLTSFVQPLDAGIICCFKAHYQRALCEHALQQEELGEEDLYKMNLLEGILMAKEAWNLITNEMIANCWNHTRIQG